MGNLDNAENLGEGKVIVLDPKNLPGNARGIVKSEIYEIRDLNPSEELNLREIVYGRVPGAHIAFGKGKLSISSTLKYNPQELKEVLKFKGYLME